MPQPETSSQQPLPPVDNVSVDSGEYFREARKWSRLMYETPITERSYAILGMTLMLCALLFNYMSLTSLFPLSAPVRLVFVNNNSGFDFPRLVRLAQRGEMLQNSIARYLARQYVIAHESYIYDREIIDQRYRFVYNQSAPDVFQTYRATLDPNNPKSPLNTLQQSSTIDIRDVYVSIRGVAIADGVANITADAYYTEVTNDNAKSTSARKKIRLQFTMLELSIHKPSKSVYQYNPTTKNSEKLEGRLLFRINSYQPAPLKG